MPRKAQSNQIKSSSSNAKRSFDDKLENLRIACEQDIYTFACAINPHRIFGEVHKKILRWMADGKNNKLLLIPRDHQKSFCAAVYVAWKIARDPTETFLYISATATLAEKQLYLIKSMLESEYFKNLWPTMLKDKVGERDRWTTYEINVDHPLRREKGIRDATITTGGVGKNIAGLHPRNIIGDDVVSPDNVETEEGRSKVRSYYSYLASIESAEGFSMYIGTRYHPNDLYNDLLDMHQEIYNKFGDFLGTEKVYDSIVEVVEKDGYFLWPKQKDKDGREYGFDAQLLATKKAKYLDKTQFYAQYYNNPNQGSGKGIRADTFQYYEERHIKYEDGKWFYRSHRLNLYAAIDFAFSVEKGADYTAIVLLGMDEDRNLYVLDIDRFKTSDINEYIVHIVQLQAKWNFKKMCAEITTAQDAIVNHIKDCLWQNGSMITIDKVRPISDKKERIESALTPFYHNGKVWHFRGGLISKLEDELVMEFPDHDDIKDAMAAAASKIIPPARTGYKASNISIRQQPYETHPVFGGVIRRRVQ